MAAMIELHTNHPTFSTDNFTFADGNFFVKTVHLNHPDMDAVTLANFRVINSDVNPKFQYTGTWYEYFTGDSIEVSDTQERITFGPGEFRVYTSKRLVPPGGFLSGTRDLPVSEIKLYPNLISGESWVYGELPEDERIVSAILYDLAGKAYRPSLESDNANGFVLHFGENLPSGMFVIQVQNGPAIVCG
jgi:hypothetical protein